MDNTGSNREEACNRRVQFMRRMLENNCKKLYNKSRDHFKTENFYNSFLSAHTKGKKVLKT